MTTTNTTSGSGTTQEMDSAMDTGSGADDEPEMTVGEKHAQEAVPDLDGDGVLSLEEAQRLLGDTGKTTNPAPSE